MRRIGHCVPNYTLGFFGNAFTVVDAQKESAIGRIVYLGCDVTSTNILEKIKKNHFLVISDAEVIRRLDDFLVQLQAFKIGHLVRCVTTHDSLKLELVAAFSPFSKPVPLP